jgi:hypothetical protein
MRTLQYRPCVYTWPLSCACRRATYTGTVVEAGSVRGGESDALYLSPYTNPYTPFSPLSQAVDTNHIHCALCSAWPGVMRWLYVTKCENVPSVTTRSLFVLYKCSVSYIWPCCTLSDIRRNRRDDVAVWRPKRLSCPYTLAWSPWSYC